MEFSYVLLCALYTDTAGDWWKFPRSDRPVLCNVIIFTRRGRRHPGDRRISISCRRADSSSFPFRLFVLFCFVLFFFHLHFPFTHCVWTRFYFPIISPAHWCFSSRNTSPCVRVRVFSRVWVWHGSTIFVSPATDDVSYYFYNTIIVILVVSYLRNNNVYMIHCPRVHACDPVRSASTAYV